MVGDVQACSRQQIRSGRLARPARLLALVLLVAPLLAACGGGGSSASRADKIDKKTAPAAIQRAYGVLFDFSNPSIAAKVAVIEDGASLRTALRQALSSPLAAMATGAKVTKTTLLRASACKDAAVKAPCARVHYNILGSKGSVLLRGASGYAVHDHRWLVAHNTICGLLTTMYQTLGKKGTPKGC